LANTRALTVAIDSISKIIFDFVDGDEKFGIEFKASLNKSALQMQQANAQADSVSKNPRV